MTVGLNSADIFARAEEGTCLSGLADDGLRQRLERIVAAVNAQGLLTANNLDAARTQIETRVAERLKLEADLRRYPEINNEAIERPIFVVGYSRTGTTVMHSLLGEDPASRMPRFWEAQSFSPPQGVDPLACNEQIAAGYRECRDWLDYVPGMLTAHPYFDGGGMTPIEDEEIFSVDFQGAYPTHYYRVPFSPLDTTAADPGGACRFLKQFLQYRQYRMASRRWVCKGVFHQFFLDQLWEVFPDALCVWTHRNPVDVVASTLGIYTLLYDAITGGIDRPGHARRMVQSMREGYDHLLNQPWLDDPRVVHVRFQDFIADQVGVIRDIYDRGNLPFTDEHERNIGRWLGENRVDRHGKFTYSLDGFGITGEELQETFADYTERFTLA